jgi:hypothetical protein
MVNTTLTLNVLNTTPALNEKWSIIMFLWLYNKKKQNQDIKIKVEFTECDFHCSWISISEISQSFFRRRQQRRKLRKKFSTPYKSKVWHFTSLFLYVSSYPTTYLFITYSFPEARNYLSTYSFIYSLIHHMFTEFLPLLRFIWNIKERNNLRNNYFFKWL